MNAKEAAEFEASDTFHTILDLRHWDDLGKEREVPATNEKTDYYKGLCKKLLVAQEQVAVKEIEAQWLKNLRLFLHFPLVIDIIMEHVSNHKKQLFWSALPNWKFCAKGASI